MTSRIVKNLIESYNLADTIMVITSFPNPVNGRYGKRNFNAVAWHSEKTLFRLSKKQKILVLAEKTGEKKGFQVGKNLLVKRVWQKSNPLSFIPFLFQVLKMSRISSVFVQFEFNVFGGTIMNILLLGILSLLRLTGRHISFELHQVILDVKPLENHVNIKNRVVQKILNLSLRVFYFLLGKICNKIIVFENELKKRLLPYIAEDKIKVLSIPVSPKKSVVKKKARQLLNLPTDKFIVLLFGFINGYKGIDFAIDAFKDVKSKNLQLLIAGGKNPYLQHKPYYEALYQSIVKKAEECSNTTYTNFVPDSKVKLYFSAADLVILPYEVYMSASGPFSLALSYGKPVILSNHLSGYSESTDFAKAMQGAKLSENDLFFDLEKKAFIKRIKNLRKNKRELKKLAYFSRLLAKTRDSEVMSEKYLALLARDQKAFFSLPRFKVAVAK